MGFRTKVSIVTFECNFLTQILCSEDIEVDVEEQMPAAPEPSDPPPAVGHDNSIASSATKALRKRNSAKKDVKGKSSAEDWELDCEICGSKGRNKVRDLRTCGFLVLLLI